MHTLSLDTAGGISLTGSTRSPDSPVSAEPYQRVQDGGEDAFAVKLRTLGTGLVYSTYLGGSGNESGAQVATGPAGGLFVVGGTESRDFPSARPLQPALRGTLSGYVTLLNSTGSRLLVSTTFGGDDRDLLRTRPRIRAAAS